MTDRAARVEARTRRIILEVALVLVGFTVLAVLVTWPAAANANTILPTQGIAWDPAGFTWDLWQRLQEGMPLFGTGSTALVVPFDITYPAAFNLVQLAFYGPAVGLAALTTPMLAMNALIIAGIATSGMAMYALARWLGCGPGASAWAGGALAIAPYVLGKAVVHVTLVNVACFPLLLLAMLWWNERPSWRRALAVTGAFALAWTTTAYYGLTAMVMVAVVCGWGVIALARRRSSWRPAATQGGILAALLGILVVVPIAISVLSSAAPTPARSSAELAQFGARPADFVTPPPNGWMADGVNAAWAGSTTATGEQAIIYLGISVILLALAAVVVAWWRPGWLGSARAVTAARITTVLAPLLAWFALAWPTTIGPFSLPVPSIAVWNLAPEFRAFARFGVAVMVVGIMAGAILLMAIARRGGPLWRHSIIAAAMIVTGADLATSLPVTTTPPASPDGRSPWTWPAWSWLRDQPGKGAVVEYPIGPTVNSPLLEQTRRVWQVGQLVHGRALLDGLPPMGQAADPRIIDMGRQVADPAMPGVARDLATAGVAFAAINPWAYRGLGLGDGPAALAPPPGFTVARRWDDGTVVWRVAADPEPALALFRQPGFGDPAARAGTAWYPMATPVATVTTWAPTRRVVTLDFPVTAPVGTDVTARVAGAPAARITKQPAGVRVTLRTGPLGRAITFTAARPTGVSIARPTATAGG